jgi:hypothetical protein
MNLALYMAQDDAGEPGSGSMLSQRVGGAVCDRGAHFQGHVSRIGVTEDRDE